MNFVSKYKYELILVVVAIAVTKLILLGYNLLGYYEFNYIMRVQ